MSEEVVDVETIPQYEQPSPKRGRVIIIIVLVLLLLCCCCTLSAVLGWGGWTYGDQIIEDYISSLNIVWSGIYFA